jgi:hypothetical protein
MKSITYSGTKRSMLPVDAFDLLVRGSAHSAIDFNFSWLRFDRKRDRESRSDAWCAFAFNRAVMCLNDRLRNGQPQSAAVRFAGGCSAEEPFENSRLIFFGDADTFIAKANANAIRFVERDGHFLPCG